MLVSGSLASLANGVSQQPSTARLSSQGEEQENGQSSIVEGLGKRPPTHHQAKVINGVINAATMHLINRDTTERYEVVITNNSIKVFDIDGVEKTVTVEDADGYLEAEDPQSAFRAVSIADYTIISNAEKTVEMRPAGGSAKLLIVDPQTDDEYVIKVYRSEGGSLLNTATYTVTAGQTAAQVADGIADAINATDIDTLLTVTNTSNAVDLIRIETDQDPFYISVTLNGEYLVARWVEAGGTEPDATGVTELRTYEPHEAVGFFFVKQGNYGTKYRIEVEDDVRGFFAEKTTSNTVVTDIDTRQIASDLYNTIVAVTNFNTDYTATLSGNLIRVKKISPLNARFIMKAEDGNGNRNMVAVKGSLQKFTDLPATCFSGFRIKIVGEEAAEQDDYYVQFEGPAGAADNVAVGGTWNEVARRGEPDMFEPALMPHVLIRQADGAFTFGQQDWDRRPAGDGVSNPEPSFVGTPINDISFFRNRLGFLADENSIRSAVGPNFFRFFRATVTAILDGDPIDVAASNVKVSILRNEVPFSGDKSLLFSDQQQFVFTGGDLLTPKTAAIKPSTAYEASRGCKPVAVGKAVYFPTEKGDNSGLREYSTDATTAVDDAVDITAHVPSYIPANVYKLAAAPNENLILALTRDDPETIYVYKYYFVGNDKLQASWSKWPMTGEVLDANFIGSTLHLLIQREDGVYMERMGVDAFRNDTNMDYEVLLDRRFLAGPGGTVTGTYNSTTNLTTFSLPYETEDTVQAVVRDNGSIPSGFYESQLFSCTKNGANTAITITGDVSAVPLIIGTQYSFEYEFSEIILKQAAGQGGERPLTGGRLQLRTMSLVFDRTGYFRVEVTPLYGDTYTYKFTPKILSSYVSGSFELQAGEFRFPIAAKSDQVTIRVINDSPYPSRLLSATWEGEFVMRTRRL